MQSRPIITQSNITLYYIQHFNDEGRMYIILQTLKKNCIKFYIPGIILCMCPANERWHYYVTSSLIGLAHTQNDPSTHLHGQVMGIDWENILRKIDHVITELHCISQISLVLRCTFWDLDPVHDSAVSLQLSSTSSSWPWSPRSSWGHHGRSHRSAARGPGRLSTEVCWRVGSAGSRSRGQCHTLSTRLWNMAPAGNNSNVKSIGEE